MTCWSVSSQPCLLSPHCFIHHVVLSIIADVIAVNFPAALVLTDLSRTSDPDEWATAAHFHPYFQSFGTDVLQIYIF